MLNDDKNLEYIRRFDSLATKVMEYCANVTLFQYSAEHKEMQKTDLDGELFIYRRIAQPLYSLIIVNRQSDRHFVEPITAGHRLDHEVPHIVIEVKDGNVFGIYVDNEERSKRVYNTMRNLWLNDFNLTNNNNATNDGADDDGADDSPHRRHTKRLMSEQEEREVDNNNTACLAVVAVSSASASPLQQRLTTGETTTTPTSSPAAAASSSSTPTIRPIPLPYTNNNTTTEANDENNDTTTTTTSSVSAGDNNNSANSSKRGGGNFDNNWSSSTRPSSYSTRYSMLNSSSVMRGLCGLQNLGNTCFMNSAIQCLSNVPELTKYFLEGKYVDEINAENPLGTHGHLVKDYADLLKDMWSGQCASVRPTDLKRTIGHFAPRFTGHAQHDSQELTAFLLDGLHEDLNRIKKKPYVEEKELDGQNETLAANQSWADYRKRNDSIIVDLLHGQHKSTLTCNVCDKISIKFEPFCFLSVPVPTKEQKSHSTVIFMRAEKWAKFYVTHTTKTTVHQLKHMLREQLQLPSNTQILISSSNSGKMLADDSLLPGASTSSYMYSYNSYNVKLFAHAVEPGPVILVENHFNTFSAPLLLPYPIKLTRRTVLDQLVPRVRELYLSSSTLATAGRPARYGGAVDSSPKPTTSSSATTNHHHSTSAAAAPSSSSFFSPLSSRSSPTPGPSSSSSSSTVVALKTSPPCCSGLSPPPPPPPPPKTSSSSSSSFSSTAAVMMTTTTTPVASSSSASSGSSCSFSASTLSPPMTATNWPSSDHRVRAGDGDGHNNQRSGGSSPARSADAVTTAILPHSSLSLSTPVGGGGTAAAAATSPKSGGDVSLLDDSVAASPLTPSSISDSNATAHDTIDEAMMMDTDIADDNEPSPQQQHQQQLSSLVLPTPTAIELMVNQTRQKIPFPEDMDEEVLLDGDQFSSATSDFPITLKLFWVPSIKTRFAVDEINQLVEREVNMTSAMKKCYTLKECIDLYTQQEQLNEEDSWYCPNCKMHRRAFKKLDLWTLPQILIIHLKRFIYSRYTRDKIETELEIPIRGFDLGDKVLNPAHNQEKYDLIGISNHSGGLGSGHYTACALNGTQWCEFNDSSAYQLRLACEVPDVLVSREAYMLFYRRRDH